MDIRKSVIGFIGAGRVGFTLGRYFKENGLSVAGYYSKTHEHAYAAAQFTDSKVFDKLRDLIMQCDIIFITVSDGAIETVADEIYNLTSEKNDCESISIKNKIFCHCSGALSSAVFFNLEQTGGYGYSIHPMFAINDREQSYKEISKAFFTIEGNKEYLKFVSSIMEELGNEYQIIDGDKKTLYHSAAVMGSNLVIGLFDMAANTLRQCGFSEEGSMKALLPLFINNALNLEKTSVTKALTGPVDRGDYRTVQKHLDVLDEKSAKVYSMLSLQLLKIAGCKYGNEAVMDSEKKADYEKLEKILKDIV